MKKIIYILVLSLFVFNCSKSDDDNSPESCNNFFLECNDGSTWILHYASADMLLRINDNLNNPLEQWLIYDGEDCYEYYSIIFGDATMTENTKDKLVIKDDYVLEGISGTSTFTFSIVNGELKFIYQDIFDGESYEEILILQETTIDVDKLTICP